ncbi:hypothetical protein B296_00050866, partial [Ensete ventricosum]
MNMCSKCHKDMMLKQEQAKLDASSIGNLASGKGPVIITGNADVGTGYLEAKSLSAQVSDESGSIETREAKAEGPNRCNTCRKRVGLTGFRCRCGDLFCSVHRYSDKHDCPFDYQTSAREAIAKANPLATTVPPGAADWMLIFCKVISVQVTLWLQLRLMAVTAVVVPAMLLTACYLGDINVQVSIANRYAVVSCNQFHSLELRSRLLRLPVLLRDRRVDAVITCAHDGVGERHMLALQDEHAIRVRAVPGGCYVDPINGDSHAPPHDEVLTWT